MTSSPLRVVYVFAVAVFCCCGFSLCSASDDFAPMFPFVISHDAPDNITNIGSWNDSEQVSSWRHAPAGKHGFIRVQDGRFVHDDGRFLILGTNTCFSANFPEKEQAEQIAARLARLGFNCVRLHHMDMRDIWGPNAQSQSTLDPAQMDKLDYFIYQLKLHGIYVNINLHVSRTMDERDGFTDKDKRPKFDKGLDNFYPPLIEAQKKYARDLLTHVNPYTKTAYFEDPAVAMVEINNENSVVAEWSREKSLTNLPDPYQANLRKLWNEFLREKYQTTTALRSAWNCIDVPLAEEMLAQGGPEPKRTESAKWFIETDQKVSYKKVADGNVMRLEIEKLGEVSWHPQMIARSLKFEEKKPYTFSTRIRSDKPATLGLNVRMNRDPWDGLGFNRQIEVGPEWKNFRFTFFTTKTEEQARFDIGSFQPGVYEFADSSLKPGGFIGLEPGMKLEEGTIPVPNRSSDTLPTAALDDFCDFLLEIEEKYWVGFYRFLKEEIGVRQPISGTQLRYGSTTIQAKLDYIDNHAYWNHPVFPGRPWDSNNWFIRNRALVQSPDRDIFPLLGTARVHGKPYTISEIDSPMPNGYAAELLPMTLAFGRFQDWDGLFHFAYTHASRNYGANKATSFFDMVGNTVKLAHMPACTAMFRRGDVAPAERTVLGGFTPEKERELFKRDRGTGNFLFRGIGLDPRLTLLYRTALDISGTTTDPMLEVSEADLLPKGSGSESEVGRRGAGRSELTWGFLDKKSPFFIAGAKNSALFTGFAHEERTLQFTDGVTLILSGKTRLNWATISLVSVDANGFKPEKVGKQPVRVLVTATGQMQNTGMDIRSLGEDRITFGSRWGEGPVLCEGIPFTLLFEGVSAIRCFPLDGSGNRKGKLDVQGATVQFSPKQETIWYELELIR